MAVRIAVKFLVLSDTHGHDFFSDDDDQRDPHWSQDHMPEADVVLHCGDLTNNGSLPDHVNALDMLSKFNAEIKLVIAGNHDRTLDLELMAKASIQEQQTSRKALYRWNCEKARDRGIHYLDEGLHTFTLSSGASFTVFASPYTPEFNNWAFGYPHSVDRFEILRSSQPDIVMTHGPPLGYLDYAYSKDLGCPYLLSAVTQAKPQLHCFGHIHEGAGAKVIDWQNVKFEQPLKHTLDWIKHDRGTLFVNAATLDGQNLPVLSSPWKIELLLQNKQPKAEAKDSCEVLH